MKLHPVALTLLLLSAASARAQFAGTEDFSGAVKNPAKWGSDVTGGSGQLSQIDGILRFTCQGLTESE